MVLAGSIFGMRFFSEIPIWKLPDLLASMRAKEYCTCHFSLKKDDAYCKKKISKGYPFIGEQITDKQNRKVTFNILGATATATHVSERFGCLLKQ
jgi:hypothetical protein